jgi:DNA-binding MarR family transcriptional regulator
MSSGRSEINGFLALFDCIGELARRRYQMAERYFAPLGLNHTEARLLTLLGRQDGVASQDALTQQLSVDRSNAVRSLQRLERDGYVRRRKDNADKRANLVQITSKGRTAVVEVDKLRQKMARNFFAGLQEDEAGAIAERLRSALAIEPE